MSATSRSNLTVDLQARHAAAEERSMPRSPRRSRDNPAILAAKAAIRARAGRLGLRPTRRSARRWTWSASIGANVFGAGRRLDRQRRRQGSSFSLTVPIYARRPARRQHPQGQHQPDQERGRRAGGPRPGQGSGDHRLEHAAERRRRRSTRPTRPCRPASCRSKASCRSATSGRRRRSTCSTPSRN